MTRTPPLRLRLELLNAIALMLVAVAARAQVPADPAAPPAPPPTVTEPKSPPPESLSSEQRFMRGKRSFEYRDCPGTIGWLADLAVPGLLDDERQQLDVHRMLGICYALADQRREATREFSSLLSLDPDHQLDPFEVPPPVIELFEAQKQQMKSRLDELRKARERTKDDLDDGGVLVERTTTISETPLVAAFLPFGLAQVANGDVVKGAVIGSVQGVGLLLNVVGFWGSIIVVEQGFDDGYSQEEADIENAFVATKYAGLGLLVAGYGVGVADALWNHEDQSVLASKATRRPLTPKELKDLKRIERAPDPPPPEPVASP